jgi:hypothetical protein
MIDTFRDAYYYVLGRTRRSARDDRPARPVAAHWPVIASQAFTFAWTGSVLVYVMTQIGGSRRAQRGQAAGR